MEKFIITDSKETADTLFRNGFKLAGTDKKVWFFVNEGKERLAKFNKLKISFTNNLFFTA